MADKSVVTERVYLGRDNENLVTFENKDPLTGTLTDMDFSNVTRMVLALQPIAGGAEIQADTGVDATYIDYSVNGQLTFKLGDLPGLTEGDYIARLTAYDGLGDDTEILHEASPQKLFFAVEATSTIT